MNLFEIIILDVILLSFPIIIWLLYQVYIKTLNKEKNNILFDLALFSSTYLVLKYGIFEYKYLPILICSIPIVFAYYKKRDFSIIVLSLVNIIYFNDKYNLNIVALVIFNAIYYGIYVIMKVKNKNDLYIRLFIIWKICINFFLIIFLTNSANKNEVLKIIIFILFFFVIMQLIMYLFKQEEEIISLHFKMREVQHDKNITDSLFKITHEIKNPIAVCKGYLDMFDVNNVEHSKKYIPILKNEISKVLVLLEDFLSINRIKIDKDIVDINLLLEDVLNNFKPILESDNIKCDFEENDEEVYILADYNRLSQVIVNVVKNSMESIRKNKEGIIKVYTEKNKNNFKIFIEDNGEGISKENLEKMKEPFFTTKSNGTGLGVYLSREIIKLHDGSMVYKSKINDGTKVIITLPLKKDIKIIS